MHCQVFTRDLVALDVVVSRPPRASKQRADASDDDMCVVIFHGNGMTLDSMGFLAEWSGGRDKGRGRREQQLFSQGGGGWGGQVVAPQHRQAGSGSLPGQLSARCQVCAREAGGLCS